MKKIIITICFFLLGISIKAQDVTGIVLGTFFDYQIINNTQHNFIFHTYFSIGYGGTCPQLINPEFSIINDTLYVKGYYDIRGIWPDVGCDRIDTATYNYQIPSNITHIITTTNVIKYSSNPSGWEVIENVYTRDFDLSQLSTSNFNTKTISIYPNPTIGDINIPNDISFDKISINNSLGQIITVINKNQSGVYNLQNIKDGLYYVTFYNANNEKIGVSKLIKKK
jgi:hypothetical protein